MKVVARLFWIAVAIAGLGGLAWLAFRPLPHDVADHVVVAVDDPRICRCRV